MARRRSSRGAGRQRAAGRPAGSTAAPRPPRGRLVALALASVVLTLGALELGVRAYYAISGVPPIVSFGSTSEEWEQRWIDRHRDQGLEVYYGFDQYNPIYGWSIRPNLRAYQFGSLPPVTTNAEGWRSRHDYAHARQPGVGRIAVLGDSFTFGEQAHDDDVWTVDLERQLDHTEVYNFGVHGFGTDQQLLVLEHDALAYHPDIVVLGFFVEDILRNGLSFRDYAKPMFVLKNGALVLTDSPVPPPERVLAEASGVRPWSDLLHFVRTRLTGAIDGANLDDVVDDQGLSSLTHAILERMQRDVAAAGAKLLVVIIPSRRAMPRVEEALGAWAGEIGYTAVNVGPALDAAEKAYGKSMYTDFYHSALGDLVMSAEVRRTLVDRGWVAAPSPETLARFDARLREAAK